MNINKELELIRFSPTEDVQFTFDDIFIPPTIKSKDIFSEVIEFGKKN